jgi:hypothetical protein
MKDLTPIDAFTNEQQSEPTSTNHALTAKYSS